MAPGGGAIAAALAERVSDIVKRQEAVMHSPPARANRGRGFAGRRWPPASHRRGRPAVHSPGSSLATPQSRPSRWNAAMSSRTPAGLTRRGLFEALAAAGVGTAVFQRAVAAQAEKAPAVTPEMIEQAEWVAGLKLSPEERKAVAGLVGGWQDGFRTLRAMQLKNAVPFPLTFNPAPWLAPAEKVGKVEMTEGFAPKKPDSEDDLAFLPVHELAALVRTRAVSSTELTKLYLKRLEKFDAV